MKKRRIFSLRFSPLPLRLSSERGVALILTLAILTLVTLMVISFATSMRVENTASKNFNDLIEARQLAQAAVDEAVAKIRQATPVPNANSTWAVAPGVIYTATRGAPIAQTELYSAGTDTVDINANNLITGINAFYPKPSPINVSWENLTAGGQLAGRIAYWVDSEAAKVNLNYANTRDATLINQSLPADIDLRAIEPPFSNALPATIQTFFDNHNTPPAAPVLSTTEEMRRGWPNPNPMPYIGYLSNKFFTAVNTVDENKTAFGADRVDINSIAELDITTVTSPIRKLFGSDPVDPIGEAWALTLYSAANGMGLDPLRDTLQKKYGDYGVEQILANIIEYKKPYNAADVAAGAATRNGDGIPLRSCGLKKFPLLGEVMVQAAANLVENPPGSGLWNITVSVYCDARLVNPYDTALGVGGTVKFVADSISVEATPAAVQADLVFGPAELPEITRSLFRSVPAQSHRNLNSNWQPGGTVVQRISIERPDNLASSAFRKTATYTDTGGGPPTITRVTVRMRTVRFLRTAADNTIQDWATQSDFDLAYPSGMEFSSTSLDGGRIVLDDQTGNGTGLQGSGDSPRFSTSGTSDARGARLGIAKNDPRVRTFPGQIATSAALGLGPPRAWFKPTASAGCFGACGSRPTGSSAAEVLGWTPTLTEPANFTQPHYRLLADNQDIFSSIGGAPVQEAQSTFQISENSLTSLGELSYIHTGYQWRTVRLRSSVAYTGTAPIGTDPNRPTYTAVEQDALPDWVMLDMFKVGTAVTAPARINLNWDTRAAGPVAGLVPRVSPVRALLNASTANLSLAGNDEAQLNTIAGYIANGVFPPLVPPNPYSTLPAYFTPGEVCEIFDVDWYDDPRGGGTYDLNPSKTEREQTVRRISNLVTTRSNLFSIWAIAQSIKEPPGVPGQILGTFTPGLDQITGEVKVQAIVERYEDPPGTVRFRTRYFRYF